MDNIIRISTGIEGADEKDAFMITREAVDAAIATIRDNNVPEDYFVRIAAESSSCCGLSFFLEFDNEIDPGRDRVIEEMGLKFVIDNVSIFQLAGVTLDFDSTPGNEGFLFRGFRDPHASCGCESDGGHHHHHGGGCCGGGHHDDGGCCGGEDEDCGCNSDEHEAGGCCGGGGHHHHDEGHSCGCKH